MTKAEQVIDSLLALCICGHAESSHAEWRLNTYIDGWCKECLHAPPCGGVFDDDSVDT